VGGPADQPAYLNAVVVVDGGPAQTPADRPELQGARPQPEPLALLAQDDPDHLIASAHPVPAEGRLVLSMATTYTALTPASRRRWAERWQRLFQESSKGA
jgi:hypothetical protein